MKLAVFYALVAVAYLAVTLAAPSQAEALFPFVALMLLAPALYAEVLRVRRNR